MFNNYSYDINRIEPHRDLTFSNDAKKYNYTEIYGKDFTKIERTSSNKQTINEGSANNIFNLTMSQNHHFKLEIDQIMVNNSFNHIINGYTYKNGKKVQETRGYKKFLPIKSMDYKPVSVESTRLQFGIFSDFPIIHRRKVGSINITLLDDVNCNYEKAVYNWFGKCVPTSTGFVAPMLEIISKAKYIEYNNQGKVCKQYIFEVIPEGDVSVSRNYENNSLKEVSFSVLIISDIEGEVNNDDLYKSNGRLDINQIDPEKTREVYYITKNNTATGEMYSTLEEAQRRANQLTYGYANLSIKGQNPVNAYGVLPMRIPEQEYNTYANNNGGARILNKSFNDTSASTVGSLRKEYDFALQAEYTEGSN